MKKERKGSGSNKTWTRIYLTLTLSLFLIRKIYICKLHLATERGEGPLPPPLRTTYCKAKLLHQKWMKIEREKKKRRKIEGKRQKGERELKRWEMYIGREKDTKKR
jgi:hypothetical protein